MRRYTNSGLVQKLSLSVILMTLCFISFGKHVGQNDAQKVANNFYESLIGKGGYSLELLLDYSKQPLYNNFYIFKNDEGFVIVSADDRTIPILAYSTEGTFESENIPENLAYWLSGYEQAIQAIIDEQADPSEEIVRQWQEMLEGNLPQQKNVVIPELLSTKWDQHAPYNNLCPSGTLTGCVATAMAQIMKYWEHPVHGTGSHSYIHPTYGTLSANFGNTTYDWDNMHGTVTVASPYAEQLAVATLMFHCGVSVNMIYGTEASSAYSEDVPYAIESYFGYNASNILYKSNYSNSAWISLLKSELDAYRPIYYCGSGIYGGHAFVCDGYDSDNKFHFNWGWSGNANGYFAIGNLNPNNYPFNSDNAAILIEPVSEIIDAPTNLMAEVNGKEVSLSQPSHPCSRYILQARPPPELEPLRLAAQKQTALPQGLQPSKKCRRQNGCASRPRPHRYQAAHCRCAGRPARPSPSRCRALRLFPRRCRCSARLRDGCFQRP